MKYSIKELKNTNNFKMLLELEYAEILSFVIKYIKKLNPGTIFYFLFNLFFLVLIILLIIQNLINNNFIWGKILTYSLYGLLIGFIFIIPIHELLHGLTYKLAGAKKISFGAIWKDFAFYVTADKFVVNKLTIILVALTPFLIVNIFFLAGIIFSGEYQKWTFIVAAFAHGSMCIGDFAILSFFLENKGKEIYTYDNRPEKKSYFYEKINKE